VRQRKTSPPHSGPLRPILILSCYCLPFRLMSGLTGARLSPFPDRSRGSGVYYCVIKCLQKPTNYAYAGCMKDAPLPNIEARFRAYAEKLSTALGHADRVEPFQEYCTGLLLPVERKSVEPMAAQLAPGQVSAKHQSLHHFVAKASWSDEAVMKAVRDYVCQRCRVKGRFWPGSWMTPDFPRRASILSG
jgi:hypothetical protein